MDKSEIYSKLYASIMSGVKPCDKCEDCVCAKDNLDCEEYVQYKTKYDKYIEKYFNKRRK